MTTHSSILAWKIPWTEEPGRLQSMGSQRVGHNWVTEHTQHTHGACKRVTTYMTLCVCARARAISHVQLFGTLWTVVCQTPLSMGFSRQEYWSGCYSLPQTVFLSWGLNPQLLHLLHWQADDWDSRPTRTMDISEYSSAGRTQQEPSDFP